MPYEGAIPKGVNNLRINQSIFLGKEIAYGYGVEQWGKDVIRRRAEIIKIQTKPSLPKGKVAVMNAF